MKRCDATGKPVEECDIETCPKYRHIYGEKRINSLMSNENLGKLMVLSALSWIGLIAMAVIGL